MGIAAMMGLMHRIVTGDNLLALLVTLAVAVLVVCCVECNCYPRREDDEIFRHLRWGQPPSALPRQKKGAG